MHSGGTVAFVCKSFIDRQSVFVLSQSREGSIPTFCWKHANIYACPIHFAIFLTLVHL